MIDFLMSPAGTAIFLVVVISSYTGLCGFLIGRSWKEEEAGDDGGEIWDVPDFPPDTWEFGKLADHLPKRSD